jgi:hypothetical protein
VARPRSLATYWLSACNPIRGTGCRYYDKARFYAALVKMKRMTATTSHLVGIGMYAFAPHEITFRTKSTLSFGANRMIGILGTRSDSDLITFSIGPFAISVPSITNLGKRS